MTAPTPAPAAAPKPTPPRDPFREAVETLVFVVTLVLMLKLFAVEAFVIPTGSMAETLYGIQKLVTCPDCGHQYPVNSTDEVEPAARARDDGEHPEARLATLSGATCPNCRYTFDWLKGNKRPPGNNSGDRVLVHKAIYALTEPRRADVVVFKFPVDPQLGFQAQNYIKRLWGLGGETVVIYRGDLYVSKALTYPADELDTSGKPKYARPAPGEEDRLWEGPEVSKGSRTSPKYPPPGVKSDDYTYHNTSAAVAQFAADLAAGFQGTGFQPIRKPAAAALAMRRIVYDNEHQSQFLLAKGVPPRWQPAGAGWKADPTPGLKTFTHAGDGEGRLAYSHRVPGPLLEIPAQNAFDRVAYVGDRERVAQGYQEGLYSAAPITNFLAYNTAEEGGRAQRDNGLFPVADLMVEATATLQAGAAVTLELAKGSRRFRAAFRAGEVRLTVVGPGGTDLGVAPTRLAAGKSYDLRFSNFDGQLRVWVDGRLIDVPGDGLYTPWQSAGFDAAVGAALGGVFAPAPWGATVQHDIAAPAGIAVTGAAEVSGLKLYADTYFTPAATSPGQDADARDPVDSYYVHPGHYFCLGDNSGQSLDGRVWGLVPERLLLGKAMFVFWPTWPVTPANRIGFIK